MTRWIDILKPGSKREKCPECQTDLSWKMMTPIEEQSDLESSKNVYRCPKCKLLIKDSYSEFPLVGKKRHAFLLFVTIMVITTFSIPNDYPTLKISAMLLWVSTVLIYQLYLSIKYKEQLYSNRWVRDNSKSDGDSKNA